MEKDQVKKQFGENAIQYVRSESHANGEDLSKLEEIVRISGAQGRMLDIATGGGHVAKRLSPYFGKVTALDLTPEMLASAQTFIEESGISNVSFILGDAEKLPFPDQSFDAAACRTAAHHFPSVEKFVREVHRILERDGRFYLADNVCPEDPEGDLFYNKIEKMRDPSHVRALKKSEWLMLLEREGFQVEHMVTFKKTFNFETWCSMMAVPENAKQELNKVLLEAEEESIQFFRIKQKDGKAISFEGQSMLMSCRKIG